MADGSIRVNTKLDTTTAKADLKKLEKECEKTAAKIGEIGKVAQAVFTGMSKGQLNNAFKTANKELAKTEEKLAAIEAKIAEIQSGTDQMLPQAATDEQAANLLEMEKAQTAPLNEERQKLTAQAAEYKNQLQAITAELEKQTQEEAAQNALKTAGKDAVAGEKFLGKIQSEEQYHAALRQTQAELAAIEQQAARIAQQTGVPIGNLLSQNSQYQSLAARQELLIANQDRFKGKVSATKAAANGLGTQFVKVGNSITKSINRSVKKVLRLSVGLLGVRSAFLVLRRAANTYLEANEDLKNQVDGIWNVIAAALGPAIQTIVNWLTIGISYINAFTKALWGVDLVARGNAIALKKQEKATAAAAGAAVKAQKQLAGFDEMNKLNDTSTGGGGGGGADAELGQFKEVEVDTEGVQKFLNIVKEIAPIIAGIGAGIAAWKIASFFTDSLSTIAGWALTIGGAVATIWGFCDAWINGLDWGNLLTMIVGIGAAVGGMALVFGTMGAAITAIVGGILLVVAGFKDWIDNGKSVEALTAISVGLLAIGAGLALIFGWPALIVAAVAALVVAVVMYWEEICNALKIAWEWICDLFSGIGTWIYDNVIKPVCDFFVGLWEDIKGVFSAIGEWFSNVFTAAWEGIKTAWGAVKEWFANLWQGIKDVFSAIGEWFANIFTTAWEGIKNAWNAVTTWFSNLWTGIKNVFSAVGTWFKNTFTTAWTNIKTAWDGVKTWFSNLWTGIKNVFDNVKTWFKDKFDKAWTAIKNCFSGVGTFFGNIWKTIKEKFTSIGSTIGNAIGGAFKKVVNSIITFAENTINGFIKAINAAIKLINKIPGVNINTLTLLDIPKLAKGGIVNNPGRGVLATVGEAGAEAILPLEGSNTGWMDILAEKINGAGQNVVIPIYLNGRKIAEEIIDINKKRTFAMNGAI